MHFSTKYSNIHIFATCSKLLIRIMKISKSPANITRTFTMTIIYTIVGNQTSTITLCIQYTYQDTVTTKSTWTERNKTKRNIHGTFTKPTSVSNHLASLIYSLGTTPATTSPTSMTMLTASSISPCPMNVSHLQWTRNGTDDGHDCLASLLDPPPPHQRPRSSVHHRTQFLFPHQRYKAGRNKLLLISFIPSKIWTKSWTSEWIELS